jgi:adenosylhomocysteine nucleosidase
MIALLGALREEVSGLQKQMGLVEVLANPACRLYGGEYRGRDVLLVQTGMGQQRAETATKYVLERYAVDTLISLGFAGALTEGLEVGDAVICAMLHCALGPMQEATRLIAYSSDGGLLRLAAQALGGTAVRGRIGSGVTVPQLASGPEERRELGGAFHADIVDMESYWIAQIASEKQIPFVAVRTISDTWQDHLPPFDQMMTAEGRLRWKEIFSYFLRHPQHLAILYNLSQNARRARGNLTIFCASFVAQL